jgi:hypothetical protein
MGRWGDHKLLIYGRGARLAIGVNLKEWVPKFVD